MSGAAYFCYENKTLPVRYHCVRIDLATSGLQIVSYPRQTGAYAGKTTRAFAQETGAQIAINATPFAGRFFKKRTVGVHIADGTIFSAPVARYDALAFMQEQDGYRARLVIAQDKAQCARAAHAFGGFWTILQDGVPQQFAHTSYTARTAAGISADGRTLYLLAVEKDAGLSFQQCADIFLALGVPDALQLDGGSSSDLAINGKSVFARTVRQRVGVSCGFIFSH